MDSSDLIPCRPGFSYLPHQIDGVRWLLQRELSSSGGVLADDMGLGKTFQIIGLLKNSPSHINTLIVVLPTLLDSWEHELSSCGFTVRTLIPSSPVWDSLPSHGPIVWLSSYSKITLYPSIFSLSSFKRVILDEGHVIRNKNTARYKSCSLFSDSSFRWILSATPIQNSLSDWITLCSWLQLDPSDPSILLRRTMTQLRSSLSLPLLSLPPPPRFIHHSLLIDDSSPEGLLLHSICDQFISPSNSLIKLELWLRLQQFIVHPSIYIDAIRIKSPYLLMDDYSGPSTKWTAFHSLLHSAISSSTPSIVFCQFHAEIDLVHHAASLLGASTFIISGSTPSSSISSILDLARSSVPSSPVVVILQILSGGVGLNLQFCRSIFFLSQHWNPAVVHQAIGRAVRIGQSHVVDIHLFHISNDFLDNVDLVISSLHSTKVTSAQTLFPTLYDSFPV